MVFRNVKYKYNSWKRPRLERNYIYLINTYSIFTFRNLLAATFVAVTTPVSIHFLNSMLESNEILKQRFERKKIKQISADYLIYSESETFKDEINNLSYV